MKGHTTEEIIFAFIDSQNLNLGVSDQGWKLDFKKFRVFLKDKYQVQKAFLFIGYLESKRTLYKYLADAGYEIIFKPSMIDKKGRIKGNIDAELVLYSAKIEYYNYDKAFIVSGDGDFYCLYKYLISQSKLGEIIIPNNKKYSKLLVKYKKYLIFLYDKKDKLELKMGVLPAVQKPQPSLPGD